MAPEYDFIVIGGGPAGMMAAGRAAERGLRVLLLEAGPEPGRKLLLSGNGRCNVTNSAPRADFVTAFGAHGGFLRPAFAVFGNAELIAWLRGRGVEIIEERKGRMFPASQQAETVRAALVGYMRDNGVETRVGQRARRLLLADGRAGGVGCDAGEFRGRGALIATGGLSYPETGSRGDGYDLARQAGHTIVPPFPAVVAFECAASWPRQLQGTPIKNCRITAWGATGKRRKLAETFGEALWTHYGISGPAIMEMSRDLVLAMRDGLSVVLSLDHRPADSDEALDEELLHAIRKSGKQQLKTVVSAYMPQRCAGTLLKEAGLEPDKKMNQVSKSERRRVTELIKRLELPLSGPRPIREAIVTGGGVSLAEVEARTMESKLVRGLYFAGEVLDIDGPTGGFNLQTAFSTGYLAGESQERSGA